MTQGQRSWVWFKQALDAVFAFGGLVLLGFMIARDSYPPLAVILVLALGGRVSMGAVERWLAGRSGE